jgi:hypothetical protein
MPKVKKERQGAALRKGNNSTQQAVRQSITFNKDFGQHILRVVNISYIFSFFWRSWDKALSEGDWRCRGPGSQEDSVITLCLPPVVEASVNSREMRGP